MPVFPIKASLTDARLVEYVPTEKTIRQCREITNKRSLEALTGEITKRPIKKDIDDQNDKEKGPDPMARYGFIVGLSVRARKRRRCITGLAGAGRQLSG
jgi:hypothetical protein